MPAGKVAIPKTAEQDDGDDAKEGNGSGTEVGEEEKSEEEDFGGAGDGKERDAHRTGSGKVWSQYTGAQAMS